MPETEFQLGSLRVTSEGKVPHVYIGGREKMVAFVDRERFRHTIEFEGRGAEESYSICRNEKGEPVISLETPGRNKHGRLGVFKVDVIIHSYTFGPGAFTASEPKFVSIQRRKFHSFFIELFLVAGIVGFAILIYLLLKLFE